MRCEIWAQQSTLDSIVLWVRVPPEAAHFFSRKVTALCVLYCFVCLTLLASFFLPSHLSLKHACKCILTLAQSTNVIIIHTGNKYFAECKCT